MTGWTLNAAPADNVSDLYAQLLQIKNGQRSWMRIAKKHAKSCGIEWSFIEQSCAILNLRLVNKGGPRGYIVARQDSRI